MILVHKDTGEEVQKLDTVVDFRGERAVVTGWQKPHSPASTGRLYVRMPKDRGGHEQGYYPSVFDCEWVDREDRQQ